MAHAEDSGWRTFGDLSAAFPSKGLVFWPRPVPADALRGSLWAIEVGESPKESAAHRFIVTRAEPTPAFLPIQGRDGPTLRRNIAEGSFRLYRRPPGRVYLSRPGKEGDWIGPFTTLELEVDRLWTLGQVSTGFVDLLEIGSRDLVPLADHALGGLRVLRPGSHLPLPKGCWNVQDDPTLLSSLLKNVRRLDPTAANALNLTQKVWRTYADSVAASGEDADAHDLARSEAVADLVEWHQAALVRSKELLDSLLNHPHISTRIDAGIRQRVEDAKQVIEERAQEAAAELLKRQSDLQRQLKDLDAAVAQQRAVLESLGRALQERRSAQVTIDRELESRVQEVIDKIVQDPMTLLTDNVVVRLLIASLQGDRRERSAPPHRSPPQEPEVEEIQQVDHLPRIVGGQAISHGFHDRVGTSLLAGWLSGRFVACSGDRAFDLLLAIARTVAGERVWTVSIPARIFGVSDTLSLPCTRIDDQGITTKLGDLLLEYDRDRFATAVVLQGLNRAPPVHLLDDLLSAMHLREGGGTLPWSDGKDARAAPIRPSPGILWCGTFSSGTTCFSLTRGVARRIYLVDADRLTTISEKLRPQACTPSRASRCAMVGWAGGASLPSALPSGLQDFAKEIATMNLVFGDESLAIAEWLIARGIPLGKDIDQLASHTGQPVKAHLEPLQREGVVDRLRELLEESIDA